MGPTQPGLAGSSEFPASVAVSSRQASKETGGKGESKEMEEPGGMEGFHWREGKNAMQWNRERRQERGRCKLIEGVECGQERETLLL